MPPKIPLPEIEKEADRLFNKTFYAFTFNFITIIATVLASALIVGSLTGMIE